MKHFKFFFPGPYFGQRKIPTGSYANERQTKYLTLIKPDCEHVAARVFYGFQAKSFKKL